MGSNTRAWHFALSRAMRGIAEGLTLHPNREWALEGGRPLVWFSKAAFEPSVGDLQLSLPDSRVVRPRGAAQVRLVGRGLFRIGLPAWRLLDYKTLMKQAGMSGPRKRAMESWASGVGASTEHWMGCHESIDLRDDDVDFEYHNGTDWVRAPVRRALEVVMEQHSATEAPLQAFIAHAMAAA